MNICRRNIGEERMGTALVTQQTQPVRTSSSRLCGCRWTGAEDLTLWRRCHVTAMRGTSPMMPSARNGCRIVDNERADDVFLTSNRQ